jgi:hypothetical protein
MVLTFAWRFDSRDSHLHLEVTGYNGFILWPLFRPGAGSNRVVADELPSAVMREAAPAFNLGRRLKARGCQSTF